MARLFRLQKHLHAHLREYTRDKQKYKETNRRLQTLQSCLISSSTLYFPIPSLHLKIHTCQSVTCTSICLPFQRFSSFFFFCQETKEVWACCPLFRCKVDMPVNAVSLSSRSGHWVGDEIMS